MKNTNRVYLRKPEFADKSEVLDAYNRSSNFHKPWAYAPPSIDHYLAEEYRYFVCLRETNAIVGTFCISGVIRGWFQSGYLGYEAFFPYQGRGYMAEGLKLLLGEAFETIGLHRLEANIQPGNAASIRLVSRAGFEKEGFSRHYLRVGGEVWKDHERWAIINAEWQDSSGT